MVRAPVQSRSPGQRQLDIILGVLIFGGPTWMWVAPLLKPDPLLFQLVFMGIPGLAGLTLAMVCHGTARWLGWFTACVAAIVCVDTLVAWFGFPSGLSIVSALVRYI
jgi:hypothetical protein